MPVTSTRNSTIANQTRNTKPRNQKQQKAPKPISETDPMYSIVPSTRSKSTISSLLLTPFSPTSPIHDHPISKKKNFTSFRGLGCRATSQVSVPAAIRTLADWESKKVKKKKQKSKKNKTLNFVGGDSISGNSFSTQNSCCNNPSRLAAPDVWCGPEIGLTTDTASVDCVVSRRPLSARGRLDVEKITPRERSSCPVRRMVSPEDYPFLDTEEMPRSRADWFGFRHHRHSHYGFPEGLAEIVMLQNSLMGGRTDGLDRYRSWRLNVDNMSYEELLELGDRIGYVSTGLKEDEITQCVRRTKPFFLNHLSHLRTELEKKCSICQEEYEAEDEMGKLSCGHFYHIHCIKQWLMHKNNCPVCKSAAMSDN